MVTMTTKTKADLVSQMVTAVQSLSSGYVDFQPGAIMLAVIEAVADVALWIQGLVLTLLAVTRAATSVGSDVDSFFADFGFIRIGATGSAGLVTFSRYSSTGTASIAPGQIVQSSDGTQQFQVVANTANAAWNVALNAYVMAAGIAAVTVSAVSVSTGAATAVQIGTVTVIVGQLNGINTVTNAAAFTGGVNAEADTAFRSRFQLWVNSLSEGTVAAAKAAVLGIQAGLSVAVLENQTIGGALQYGNFVVAIDDGSGNPPTSLLTAAQAAVNFIRPLGSTFQVVGPTVAYAVIGLTTKIGAGYTGSAVTPVVQSAIMAYVNSLGFAGLLPFSRIAQIAYDTSGGVANVTGVTINGGTADLTASGAGLIRTTSVTVTAA